MSGGILTGLQPFAQKTGELFTSLKKESLVDRGDGYTAVLAATGAGFSGVVVPSFADKIRVEYRLAVNSAVMWLAYALPNGSNANCTSRRLDTAASAVDSNELLNFPLGGSVNANRSIYAGEFTIDCQSGAQKYFFERNVVQLTTGATETQQQWAGVWDNVARLATFDIVGATSAGGLANAFLSGSWYKLFAIQNR